jgi:hypothetical protein
MFYYLLRISSRREGPNPLMIASGLPYILMSWVNRKNVIPWIHLLQVKKLEPG